MATTKISYNPNKSDAQLANAFSLGNNFSKPKTTFNKKPLNEIFEDEYEIDEQNFGKTFPFSQERVNEISESIDNQGFDLSQPVHRAIINDEPETINRPILLDGYHRLAAAKLSGLEEIPVYDHIFDTRADALKYEYSLQLTRRNLTDAEKVKYIAMYDNLKKSGQLSVTPGKSAAAIAETLSMSTRNVEKARNILKNGDDEIKQAVFDNTMSINKADKIINERKKVNREENQIDSIEDNSETPKPIFIKGRDEVENPFTPPEESVHEKDLIRRYRTGFSDGFKKGFSEAAYLIYEKFMDFLNEGKNREEIENSVFFADFSFTVLAPLFEIPTEEQDINEGFNK